jgi:hypothetical protein
MRECLYNTFLELKPARSFITPLQEDINVINAPEATNLTKPTQCSESSVCDKVNGNSLPVGAARILNNLRSLTRPNRQYISVSSRLTPLSSLHDLAMLKISDALHKLGVCYKDFDVSNIGHNAENTDCGKREATVIMLPKIGDEGVVPKAFLGIQSIQ